MGIGSKALLAAFLMTAAPAFSSDLQVKAPVQRTCVDERDPGRRVALCTQVYVAYVRDHHRAIADRYAVTLGALTDAANGYASDKNTQRLVAVIRRSTGALTQGLDARPMHNFGPVVDYAGTLRAIADAADAASPALAATEGPRP